MPPTPASSVAPEKSAKTADPTFKIGAMIVALTLMIGAGFVFLYKMSELHVQQIANEVGIIREVMMQKTRLEGMKTNDAVAVAPTDSDLAFIDLTEWGFRIGYPKNFFLSAESDGNNIVRFITSQPGHLALGMQDAGDYFSHGYEMRITSGRYNITDGVDTLVPTQYPGIQRVQEPCDLGTCPREIYQLNLNGKIYEFDIWASSDFAQADEVTARILLTIAEK
jgi:hypothetical protein